MSANPNIAALLYLVAGSLFILALKGLSSPASSRAGNRNGMIGMTIAVATTLWISGVSDIVTWALVIGGLGIGGTIGAVMAKRRVIGPITIDPDLEAAWRLIAHGHECPCILDPSGICTIPERVPRRPWPPTRKGFKDGKPRF